MYNCMGNDKDNIFDATFVLLVCRRREIKKFDVNIQLLKDRGT